MAKKEEAQAQPLQSDEELQNTNQSNDPDEDDKSPASESADKKASGSDKNAKAKKPQAKSRAKSAKSPRPRVGAVLCNRCHSNEQIDVPMQAYATKPMYTYYRCAHCGETRKIPRPGAAEEMHRRQKRQELEAKHPPIDTR